MEYIFLKQIVYCICDNILDTLLFKIIEDVVNIF